MSAEQKVNQQEPVAMEQVTCMESVNRIAKLPVVEQTIQTAQNIYGKVKDYNSVTTWTLQTAENTVHKAVEVGKPYAAPVIKNLEGPIKKVDGVLCTGLDYVESKVPAVKLPPKEIYNNTKDYVNTRVTPAVESAYAYAEPAVKTAMDVTESAVKTAKEVIEPAVEKARQVVEPIVEPIVENVKNKVDEYLQRNQEESEAPEENQEPKEDDASSGK